MAAQSINPPDLDDLLAENRESVFANLNCIQIGQVQKINNDQTCEIQIQFLRRLSDGSTAKYPLLVDCPYFVLNGGGSYIDMPISKGDYCLVLFSDRNIDDWWDTGNVSTPADTGKHNISDGIALIGINPRIKALSMDGSVVRLIGPSGEGSEKFAARIDDPTISNSSTDSGFWSWVNTITSVVNSHTGSAIVAPTKQSGKIESGSTEVKIG